MAELIARVALGQAEHVVEILAKTGLAHPQSPNEAVEYAEELLTSGTDQSHRDGWMFQVMSWIAVVQADPAALIKTPHLIHAHKGLDGLQVEFDNGTSNVTSVIIFEDKATENPRSMIRDRVWPDFKKFESGDQLGLLIAEVTGIIKAANGIANPSAAVARVVWSDARRYRVSVTVDSTKSSEAHLAKLFKGYPKVVKGDDFRRQAEAFPVTDLRPWMSNLATLAIEKAREIGARGV